MIAPPKGRSLRIFLADGTPSGIRHAELVNWSGQALVCPRVRIADLNDWEEAKRPGVYFLVGEDEMSARDALYIGEAENVLDRLRRHTREKDFWRTALVFTSKDENLTKSHVKYLESRLCEHARQIDRIKLLNSTEPSRPRLPKADQVDMEGFLGPLVTLSGALGFRFLERANASASSSRPELSKGGRCTPSEATSTGSTSDQGIPLFSFKRGDYCSGTGTPSDDGFLVFSGARGPIAQRDYASPLRQERMALFESDGSLRVEGEEFVTLRDLEFSSSSGAACFISGSSINGRKEWRLPNRKSLADWEAEQFEAEVAEPTKQAKSG